MQNHSFTRLHALRLAGLLLITAPSPALAQQGDKLVHDDAHLLGPAVLMRLEHGLERYADSTGIQLAVATVPGLRGREVSQVGDSLKNALGVGSKQTQRGILYLIAPVEHRQTVRVGRGLEADLPDALCFRILQETTPSMGQNMELAILNRVAGIQGELARAAAAETARAGSPVISQQGGSDKEQVWVVLYMVGTFLAICGGIFWLEFRKKPVAAKGTTGGGFTVGGVVDSPNAFRQRSTSLPSAATPYPSERSGQNDSGSSALFAAMMGASFEDDERKRSSWSIPDSSPPDTSSTTTDSFSFGGDVDTGGGGGSDSW